VIAWLNPVALWGLFAVLGPVLIHLLRQPRAVRVLFPSVRFVQPSRTAAARMRRIADPRLLLVRGLIVATAALALAQPVLLTGARLDAWNSRTARAIVLDTSRSMQAPAVTAAGRRQAQEEADSAFASAVFEGDDLGAAIARAAAWLHAAPPARREVVIVSDFHFGVLPGNLAGAIPAPFGIRAVQVGEPVSDRRFAGLARFGSGARQDVRLTADATAVAWNDAGVSGAGVRFLPAKAGGADRLVRAVAAAGAPAGSAGHPIAIAFASSAVPEIARVPGGWMLDTVARMSRDGELSRAAAEFGGSARLDEDDRWFAVAAAADGRPVVRAAAAAGELIVQASAEPGDYVAAAALRSALHARHGSIPVLFSDEEIVRMPASEIAALSRAPGRVGHDVAARLARSDARWLWLAALLLLMLEAWMRRPRTLGQAESARAA
jgi:hypothetical protein